MHARKRPNRTTVDVPIQIAPHYVAKLKVDAERAGYPTQRAYLEALIAQGVVTGDPSADEALASDEQTQSLAAAYPSSAWALGPTILGSRVVLALEALTERIRAGDDVEALRCDLMSARREIVEHLLALRTDYDREVETRDRRHYARFGTIDE
jgi:hypothetical protein